MIYVIARNELRPGCRDKFLAAFTAVAPLVLAEPGCLGYRGCADLDAAGAAGDFVTIVESWNSEAEWRAHLATPHMAAFRAAAGELRHGCQVTALAPF